MFDEVLVVVLKIELGQHRSGRIFVGDVFQLVQPVVVVAGYAAVGPGQCTKQIWKQFL